MLPACPIGKLAACRPSQARLPDFRFGPARALARNVRSIAPMFLKRLECSACGREHEWSRLQNLCRSCNKPLFAIVDLAAASRTLKRETLLATGKIVMALSRSFAVATRCGAGLVR